jgi:hypothetical protein
MNNSKGQLLPRCLSCGRWIGERRLDNGVRVCLHCCVPIDESPESSDGLQRLDVEYARSRVNAMIHTLKLLAEQADSLKADLGKLLDELDGTPSYDVTEPHIQVNHV